MKKIILTSLCVIAGIVIATKIFNIRKPIVYTLPPLPYEYNALEPYIDEATLHFHHDDHHRIAIELLNKTLKDYPETATISLDRLLKNPQHIPEKIRQTVIDQGGSHFNHSFFWTVMSPNGGGEPQLEIRKAIEKAFGSFDAFKEQFSTAAKQRYGSGYAWLCYDKQHDTLVIRALLNQDSPLTLGLIPVLCIDVWEHSYYLKYQYKRADFIDAWWNVVDWVKVNIYYLDALNGDTFRV